MANSQEQTPLLNAMRRYVKDSAVAFHTPGHKQGKGIHPSFKDLITDTGLAMEVSLMEELDDLFEPQTCIKEAQNLAAQLYGADITHFAVNGTTGAIQAMLLAALNPGDSVILPRNVHRSVIGAIMLIGAKPIFMQPEIDEELGIAMAVSLDVLVKTMNDNPNSKAVLLVNPTYYGVTCNLKQAASFIHKQGMLLLVDEAHGPHLKFNDELPIQALDAGADIVAQSTHKILGSLTQTSMLHANLLRVNKERLKLMNSVVQSTSPNYLLLASLDVARMQMATEGKKLIKKAVQLAKWAREQINKIEGLFCFGTERMGAAGAFALDLTKLTVTVKGLGISGSEAEQILRYKYKIQSELSDSYNVLFIISLGDSEKEVQILVNALRDLAADYCKEEKKSFCAIEYPAIPVMKILPRDALFADKSIVPFKESAGMTCGEVITFYPPGIPIICPGEIITKDIIDYCLNMKEIGLKVVGPEDIELKIIKVVK